MSLRTKFVLLLAALSAAVGVMLGAQFWSFAALDRERNRSLESIESVLGGLNRLKRVFWRQAELLSASSFPTRGIVGDDRGEQGRSLSREGLSEQFEELVARAASELDRLEGLSQYQMRSGVGRTRALRAGAGVTAAAGRAWIESGDRAAWERASEELYRQHERIEAIEGEVLRDVAAAIGHGDHLRSALMVVLATAAMIFLATGVLGVFLMHRWVLRPLETLRDAAVRIGGGDFKHRVPVQSRDEVGLLSSEMNRMAATVSTLQEERVARERLAAIGEMVQKLVHNLRGPLGGIRSLAEWSSRNVDRTERVKESLGRIVATVDRFEEWTRELLGATRPVDLSTEPVRVREWLMAAVDTHQAHAEAKQVPITLEAADAPEVAVFDPRWLEQGLSALLSNAIEASPDGARVTVTAEAAEADRWRLIVRDQGPGVPADVANRIFRPYFTTKRHGTGIGLALVKQVVEQQGGRIWLESPSDGHRRPGEAQGATFVVELPVAIEGAGVKI